LELFTHYGYVGLFAASFLAATVLPLSSELVLVFLLMNHFDPVLLVTVATTGNVVGSITNYYLGFYGGIFLLSKTKLKKDKHLERAEVYIKKYGVWSLLFAWVPVIGDPITVAAGLFRIHIAVFTLFVTAGKLTRYLIICWPFL